MLAACWACALQDLSTREGRVCWSLLVSPYRLSPQLNYQQKVGIMYCKAGQSTEEEMYNNESAGPAFEEFLQLLGERVRLKGFEKYRAQLDTKSKKHLYSCYAWLPLPCWHASANSCRKQHCCFLQKAAGEGGNRLGVGALELSETITQMAGRGLECIAVLRAVSGSGQEHSWCTIAPEWNHSDFTTHRWMLGDLKIQNPNLIVRPGLLYFYWFVT